MVPSIELIGRVRDAALAYTLARMTVLESIAGNPVGIAFKKMGGATALAALYLPSPSFNSVVELRGGDAGCVAPLVEWYRERGLAGRFEGGGERGGVLACRAPRPARRGGAG